MSDDLLGAIVAHWGPFSRQAEKFRVMQAEIERLQAEVKDLRNTHRAIRALTWEIARQNPSHLKAWIDVRMIVADDEEARRG